MLTGYLDLALTIIILLLGPIIIILTRVNRKRLKEKYTLPLLLGIAIIIAVPLFYRQQKVEFVKARNEQIETEKVAKQVEFENNRIRLSEVPGEFVKPCLDNNGQIADRDEPWEYSDAISESKLPRSRMILACKYADGTWYIQCEKGGFALQRLQYRFTKDSNNQWQSAQLGGDLKEYCPLGFNHD